MSNGITVEKLDFWAIPGLGPGPIFLLGAMPLLGRPIFTFMYKDKGCQNLQLLSLMLQATF